MLEERGAPHPGPLPGGRGEGGGLRFPWCPIPGPWTLSSGMIHPWHDVTPSVPGLSLPQHCRAVIEIPKGSSNKYELDKQTGLLRLDRVLSSAVYYPAN